MFIDIELQKIPIFQNDNIINLSKLNESFGISCEKIITKNKKQYVVKKYIKKNNKFNAIKSEGKCLQYMYERFPNFFPKTYYLTNDIIIMDYIDHDNIKDNDYQSQLAKLITKIHGIKNDMYGFEFDTSIGGLRQPSKYNYNWIEFFKEKRLGMIFEQINKHDSMPEDINRSIEKILNNIDNFLPKNPRPSLIHGDLWEGNILFNKGKISGLIDPGINYAHNEMEIAYLTWFKYVSNDFLDYYSDIINIDKYYFKYEPIYQLYYCLLNVYLWSREYISNARDLISKIKIN